jgi:Kelch motif
MAEDRDDPSGRFQWFLERRTGPDGTFPRDQLLKASQVRHQQLRQQAESPLAFQPPVTGGGVNWTPIGPSAIRHGSPAGNPVVSGRITAICAGPDNRVYVGSANGGAWFSADRGASWAPLDEWFWKAPVPPADTRADSLSVGAVAVKFGAQRENDIVFIGTGEPKGGDAEYFGVGIKVSTDGGRTFTLEGSRNLAGLGIYGLAIDPDGSNDPLVVAATTAGLYLRPPSGQSRDSWISRESGVNGPATAVIVAGTSARGNKTYYVAFQTDDAKKVYYSTDNGASWTGIGGITTPKGRIALASENPSVLYALAYDATGEPVLFRRDGNNDFTAVAFQPRTSADNDIHNLFGNEAGARQGWYDIAVAVSPANDNMVYLAGSSIYDESSATENLALFACLVYTVSGILLIPTPSYIGLGMHSDGHCLTFETKADGTRDSGVLWVGTDGGPFCSTQMASPGSFIARNDGLAITQLTYFDYRADTDAVVISGCQDNGTVRFDGNAAWPHVGPGDGGGVAVDPNNVRRVMRQGTYAHLMTCTDGALTDGFRSPGGSWRSLWSENKFPPVPDSAAGNKMRDEESSRFNCKFYTRIRAIDFGAGDTLVAFGTNRLWVTLDWGETWTTLPSGTNPLATAPGDFAQDALGDKVVDICLASATSIYVVTASFAYKFTYDNNNNTWSPSPPQTMFPPNTVGRELSSIAVDSDARGSFYLGLSQTATSTNENVWYYDGKDWHATRPTSGTSIPNVPVNALAVDPTNSNIIYVGTDVGVWKGTKQSGNVWVWEIFSRGLPEAAVFDLAIHPKARLLRAATHGRGAWEIMLDATTGHDTDVYLRAHTADNGRRFSWAENVPDPTRAVGYATPSASPDIRVCRSSQGMPSEPLDFVDFAALDPEARTLDPTGTNKIFVQVHNRGATTASSNAVTVLLLLASADNGVPPLPQGFADHIKTRDLNFSWLDGSGWKVADTTSPYKSPPADLTARTPQVVSFNLDLSTWPLTKGSVCAVPFVSAANDVISGSDAHVDTALASNKYMAAKLMKVASTVRFWRPGGTLVTARTRHYADLLRSGDVFVAGGVRNNFVPTAEIRNVFTNAWAHCADIGNCRGATVLRDGRVLLVMVGSDNYFWDPSTGGLTRGPDRHGDTGGVCTQLRLADGRVLLIAVNSSEVFDPVANSWTVLQVAPTGLFYTAILLHDGRAVVQGLSYVVGQAYRPLVYIFDPKTFDPKTGNWTLVTQNTPLPAVYNASATYLSNGRVLFIGGTLGNNVNPGLAAKTVVALDPDPINPTWSQMKPMPLPLTEHTATLLDDGTVLVVGGRHDFQMNCLSTVSRYDFATDSWQQEPNMTKLRASHTATKLPSGEVVIAGGYSSNYLNSEVADCEIYVPAVK